MSDHRSKNGGICEVCNVRRLIVQLFIEHAPEGQVGDWVDGIIDAAAEIAAAHVIPGKEPKERDVLQARMTRRFDYFFQQIAADEARRAVKQ